MKKILLGILLGICLLITSCGYIVTELNPFFVGKVENSSDLNSKNSKG